MKKLLLCLLIGVSGGAGAADWRLVMENSNPEVGSFYMDADTVQFDSKNNIVTVWVKNDGLNERHNSEVKTGSKSKEQFDCGLRKHALLSITYYSGPKSIDSFDFTSNISTKDILPDTIGELQFKAVCTNPPYITVNGDVDSAAQEQDFREEYKKSFNKDVFVFMDRPENQAITPNTEAFNLLDAEVRKLQNSELVYTLSNMELLELARSRVAKMIDLPPIGSTPKRTAPKPSSPAKTTKKEKRILL